MFYIFNVRNMLMGDACSHLTDVLVTIRIDYSNSVLLCCLCCCLPLILATFLKH